MRFLTKTVRNDIVQTVAGIVRVVWSLTFGALHDFVWLDLRDGLISLRGLAWSTRALIVGGFGLVAVLLAAIVWNDALRGLSALTPTTTDYYTVGRGSLLPVALIPLTVFLIAVAWSFALAGALHAHLALRIAALFVYELTAAGWLEYVFSSSLRNTTGDLQGLVAVGLVLAMPLFFVARRHAPANPVGEFCFILAAVAATFATATAAQNADQLGVPLGMALLQQNLVSLGGLIVPLLLVLGLDIADFARSGARWGTEFVSQRLPRVFTLLALGVVLVLRLRDVTGEALARFGANGAAVEVPQYLGAIVEMAIVWAVWFGITRLAAYRHSVSPETLDEENVARGSERIALPLVLLYTGAALVIYLLLGLVSALPAVGVMLTYQAALNQTAEWIQTYLTDPWQATVIVGALAAGFGLAYRGQVATGFFLALFGATNLWALLTAPTGPIGVLAWRGPEPRDFVLVATLVLFGALALVRRQFTLERAAQLLFLLLLTWLLRQTDFISSPFSPVLGFTGVGFIAFGLAWDALTAGAWANDETPGLPRASRILLYLGYILLTATLVNWALASHDLHALGRFTGDAALAGLEGLGRPLIFAVVVLVLQERGG